MESIKQLPEVVQKTIKEKSGFDFIISDHWYEGVRDFYGPVYTYLLTHSSGICYEYMEIIDGGSERYLIPKYDLGFPIDKMFPEVNITEEGGYWIAPWSQKIIRKMAPLEYEAYTLVAFFGMGNLAAVRHLHKRPTFRINWRMLLRPFQKLSNLPIRRST
jgi:hypothetical protein